MTNHGAKPGAIDIVAVIPAFHSDGRLQRCIAALQSEAIVELHILLVDHSPAHVVGAALGTLPANVEVLKEDSRLWWAGAVNAGIAAALDRGARWILLLNDDCVFEPGGLRALYEHANRYPDAIIAATQCRASDGRCLITASDCLLLGFPTIARSVARSSLARSDHTVPTRLIVGGRGALIPRSVFETIGVFDAANFPHYGADHDFYWRCRSAGIPMFVATNAVVEVDDRRSSIGDTASLKRRRDFLESFRNPRSHRNIAMLRVLFRKHYPIRSLYLAGIAFLVLRHTLLFTARYFCRNLRRSGPS